MRQKPDSPPDSIIVKATQSGVFGAIERQTIHPIPPEERHGRARDLFTVWFSANMTLLTVVTGALGPAMFGLSFWWSVLALLLGNMVGAVFMALHAAQGPHLGVPQMVQSRGQFGVYGSVPLIILVILMYIGFAASNCVVGGQAFSSVIPGLHHDRGIILMVVLTLLPCALGYRAIHILSRISSWVSACVVVYAIIIGIMTLPPVLLGGGASLWAGFHGAGFCGAFSVSVLWQIAYAPYVSDSSRYLPRTPSSGGRIFWASYGGTVMGAVLPMMLGSVLALHWPDRTVSAALAESTGPTGPAVLLVLALAIPLANAMSVYCGALCCITLMQTFRPNAAFGMRSRLGATGLILAVALAMGLGMAQDFLASYTAFLDILMAVLVPWTAINLVDYYLLKHGEYNVAAFFAADGGCYGLWNGPALSSYGIGVLVELPFMKTGPYTGFLVARLHGVDISWAVALAVTTLFYGGFHVFQSHCKKNPRPLS